MRFLEFQRLLKDFAVFSLSDIYAVEPSFHRRRLNEWQDKGYIKKIIRGYYIFADLVLNESSLYLIANKIYDRSYISFESALSHYQLIPESVYAVTSASSLVTRAFKTSVGFFKYHRIKPELFFGYQLNDFNGKRYKIADFEKALLDYFYIHPEISDRNAFTELRFNAELFLELGRTKINSRYIKVQSLAINLDKPAILVILIL